MLKLQLAESLLKSVVIITLLYRLVLEGHRAGDGVVQTICIVTRGDFLKWEFRQGELICISYH